eukprot:scaffold3818_cov155-Ochromonas_danica.AAC.5
MPVQWPARSEELLRERIWAAEDLVPQRWTRQRHHCADPVDEPAIPAREVPARETCADRFQTLST